ncbi:MAG: hypothetical protein V4654_12375 [Bdellovibrionota bacterium]
MRHNDTVSVAVPKIFEVTEDFEFWYLKLDGSLSPKILNTIQAIETFGVITNAKDLKNGLWEKKWQNGLRLYFSVVDFGGQKTVLLLGSGKHDQESTIKKCRLLLRAFRVLPIKRI